MVNLYRLFIMKIRKMLWEVYTKMDKKMEYLKLKKRIDIGNKDGLWEKEFKNNIIVNEWNYLIFLL